MLNLLLGRTTIERTKTIAIAGLTIVLTLFVWQVSAGQAEARELVRDREVVSDIATRFAVALTTYDYAHLSVQVARLSPVSSLAVLSRVRTASSDLSGTSASSVGDVTDVMVMTLTSSQAVVLVATVQVASGDYVQGGMRLAGLLEVRLGRMGQSFVVTDYRWLAVPSGIP